ncbi:50S ribosomal protein L4 [bacterium]|nr:50S ribosomal protein L4 [bacterium]
MLKAKIYNLEGKETGEVKLNPEVFDVKINPVLVQQVVEAYLANRRQVLAHTKTMSEVRGGGKKPWKQKGTGRARHGSSRSPIWKGGGVTFGPRKDRNFSKGLNKKMKLKALFMVLSDKFQNDRLKVVEEFKMTNRKTKELIKNIKNLKLAEKKILISLEKSDHNVQDSAKNLKNIKILAADSLNVYTLLNHEYLVLTKKAIEVINKHFVK